MRPFHLTGVALTAALFAFSSVVRADGPELVAASAADGAISFEPGTPKFEDVLAKAKASGKPVFVDFSTEWCGWCRKLEKDVFSQAAVGEVMKGFVNVHIDAEKGEGPGLAKRYSVHGFPTLLVVDASGEEIDRIVGYLPPADFTKETTRILAGEGTIPALRKKWDASPDDVEAGAALAGKLAQTRPDEAVALYTKLIESPKAKDHATEADLRLARASALLQSKKGEEAAAEAEALLKGFADTPAAAKAGARVGRAFVELDALRALAFLDAASAVAKEPGDRMQIEELAIAVHSRGIAAALKREAAAAGDDAQQLNRIAWTCFERKVNVREALGWAKTAVEKSERDPAILDTLANLLWITGAHAEAVKTEVEAASKTGDKAMKKEFDSNVAKWNAEIAARAAAKAAAKKNGKEDDDDEEDDDGDEDGK